MKKLTQLALLLALILGFVSESNAALLIEPVLGYNFGTSNTDTTVVSTGDKDSSSDSLKGASYGGRLGYQNLGFQLGLDYLASNLDVDGDTLKTSEFGGFVGFEFPILVRVYAGYVFAGSATYSSDDLDDDLKLKGGAGAKLGVGFTMFPFLDLNIEYRKVKYNKAETQVSGFDVDVDSDYSAVMVGISLPFTL